MKLMKRKEYGKEAARRKYNELRQDDEQRKKEMNILNS